MFAITCLGPTLAHGKDLTDLFKDEWEEIPESELAAQAPAVDKDSHAEYLYRSIEVDDDQGRDTDFYYHYRLKIFTQAGVDKLAKIDIPYDGNLRLSKLKARVIYPDGSIQELEKDDFHKREVFEDGIFNGYSISFSFPSLSSGCIIEYKWRITRRFWIPSLEIPLLAEYPTWKLHLVVDPFSGRSSRICGYNGQFDFENSGSKFILDKENLPELYEGVFLPPRKDFEPWIHLGYASDRDKLIPSNYWGYRAFYINRINRSSVVPNQRAVKDLSRELFKGLDTSEDKLRAAYEYCTTRITNISSYTDEYSEQEIEELKENDSPKQTIRRGYGNRMNINALFASLACNAGYEARLAMVEDRSDYSFNFNHVGYFCLSGWLVAVKDGNGWRYFDPGSKYLPFEKLNPENVHARTIIATKKLYFWGETPAADINDNKRLRRAIVSLNEHGDLSGKLVLKYSGHEALWRRRMFAEMSLKEIEDYLNDKVWQPRCPRAKISNLEIEDLETANAPLTLTCSLDIPGYAERAGDRFLLNPAVFDKGKSQFLEETAPRVNVHFSHPYIESDDVSIQLPEGFSLETTEFESVGLTGQVLNRNSKILWVEEKGFLRFLRRMALSTKLFDQTVVTGDHYIRQRGPDFEQVKQEFAELNKLDSQELLVLGQ